MRVRTSFIPGVFEVVMSKKKHKRKQSKSGKNRTPISSHERKGHDLVPPLARIPNMQYTSWMNDRLPEMLWASLILSSTERDYALAQFRRFLNFIGKHDAREELHDVTLTGISLLETDLRNELIAFLLEPPEAAQALATLRLFQSLPGRESWDELLPNISPDLDLLMDAVGNTLWHQSQQATDCRWVRLMASVLTGKWKVPPEIAEEWLGYPEEGDQRKVRPSIRAAEGAYQGLSSPDLTWANDFWDEAWRNTPCLALVNQGSEPLLADETITRQSIHEIMEQLENHWADTHLTTTIDAKHDAVFGMAFYALRILDELMGISVGNGIIGRLALRTILEVRINLRFMLTEDTEELWQKWRKYGSGQAKLNALKFDDDLEAPRHIDIDSIELIASEDIWEEFLTINLASWSDSNLRQLSEKSNLKNTYDQNYSWTSGYSHGMWGPIRESCYETCGNPLHRLHRSPSRRSLPDVVDDAAALVDDILRDLEVAFPDFGCRLISVKED
jgi:hypothetical protein